jgi:hypothetical protein
MEFSLVFPNSSTCCGYNTPYIFFYCNSFEIVAFKIIKSAIIARSLKNVSSSVSLNRKCSTMLIIASSCNEQHNSAVAVTSKSSRTAFSNDSYSIYNVYSVLQLWTQWLPTIMQRSTGSAVTFRVYRMQYREFKHLQLRMKPLWQFWHWQRKLKQFQWHGFCSYPNCI